MSLLQRRLLYDLLRHAMQVRRSPTSTIAASILARSEYAGDRNAPAACDPPARPSAQVGCAGAPSTRTSSSSRTTTRRRRHHGRRRHHRHHRRRHHHHRRRHHRPAASAALPRKTATAARSANSSATTFLLRLVWSRSADAQDVTRCLGRASLRFLCTPQKLTRTNVVVVVESLYRGNKPQKHNHTRKMKIVFLASQCARHPAVSIPH